MKNTYMIFDDNKCQGLDSDKEYESLRFEKQGYLVKISI